MSLPRVLGGYGVALGLTVLGFAASGVEATPASQQTVRVEMASNPTRFVPDTITVAPGTTVVWETTSGSHTTTSVMGLWDSERRLGVGETFSYTFGTPGVYEYVCTPHVDMGMIGRVIVSSAGKGR
jgi:plastocyanin